MTPGDLSVIIPALQEALNIERCVRSVAAAGEVIVVDGGSSDATPELAESAGARVITSRAGRAAQLNAGAQIATGQVLLFLHADNYLAPNAIAEICAALTADPQRVWGGFAQRIDAAGIAYRMLEHGNAWRVRVRGIPFGDQAIFVRRDRFEQQGGFPDVAIMEDLIFSQSVRRISRPLLLPGPVVVDPRRWQKKGVVRQTARNWMLQIAHALGMSPERLRAFYENNDPKN